MKMTKEESIRFSQEEAMTTATLYIKDKNGRVRFWKGVVEKEGSNAVIEFRTGLLQGKPSSKRRVVTKGKNLGKRNATSVWEQAIKDVTSEYEDKKKRGYKAISEIDNYNPELKLEGKELLNFLSHNLAEEITDNNEHLKPMKAQPLYKDNGDLRINFPVIGQPKFDGVRCFALLTKTKGEGLFDGEVKVTFLSKEGTTYNTLSHLNGAVHRLIDKIAKEEADWLKDQPVILDGEIYIHGEILSEISSAVKKANLKTPKLEYHVYDIAAKGAIQYERIVALRSAFREGDFGNVKRVLSKHIQTYEIGVEFGEEQIKAGYEGAIFRSPDAEYQFGRRVSTMVKYKKSHTAEYLITDVIPMDNEPDFGRFVCQTIDGHEFRVTPEGTAETKRKYLVERRDLIGKYLTVKYYGKTKNNKPFHATGVAVRDYE